MKFLAFLLSVVFSASAFGQQCKKKIDFLFVIDNSGSMSSVQQQLANDMKYFAEELAIRDVDFHVGVITTDGWRDLFRAGEMSRLRDGSGKNHSGVFVVDRNTPSLVQVLQTNFQQGISGAGDERAFSSIQAALTNPWNSQFRRSDAEIEIIIVSDEDDFSQTTEKYGNDNYNDPDLVPTKTYFDFLKTYAKGEKFRVSSISILDQACLDQSYSNAQKISIRYNELVNMTGGTLGSICNAPAALDQILKDHFRSEGE